MIITITGEFVIHRYTRNATPQNDRYVKFQNKSIISEELKLCTPECYWGPGVKPEILEFKELMR